MSEILNPLIGAFIVFVTAPFTVVALNYYVINNRMDSLTYMECVLFMYKEIYKLIAIKK